MLESTLRKRIVWQNLRNVQQESRQGEIRKEFAVNYGRYLVR